MIKKFPQNVNDSYVGPLGGFIDHPEWFDREPWLKNVEIEFQRTKEPGAANWDPRKNKIYIESNSPENAIQDLEHEVQHAVQDKYGWPAGASWTYTQKEVTKNWKQYSGILDTIIAGHRRSGYTALADHMQRLKEEGDAGGQEARKWLGSQVYLQQLGEAQARLSANRAVAREGFPELTVDLVKDAPPIKLRQDRTLITGPGGKDYGFSQPEFGNWP